MENYSISIVNNRTKQSYKKFMVDGLNTIGVDELEPFSIVFKNNTYKRVQVRISVDGTDVCTGKLASTNPEGSMFIVEGYRSLELKAWPEDSKGGAEFLFTPESDGVSINTHGNISSKGIIAVAVFEEGQVLSPSTYWEKRLVFSDVGGAYKSTTKGLDNWTTCTSTNSGFTNSMTLGAQPASCSFSNSTSLADSVTTDYARGVAVGAGERVDQNIVKTAGLNKPVFASILQVKYLPWMELRSRIRTDSNHLSYAHPGFPGDAEKMINIKNTPRYARVADGVVKKVVREVVIEKFVDISRFE